MNPQIIEELCKKFGSLPEVISFNENLYQIDLSIIMTSG